MSYGAGTEGNNYPFVDDGTSTFHEGTPATEATYLQQRPQIIGESSWSGGFRSDEKRVYSPKDACRGGCGKVKSNGRIAPNAQMEQNTVLRRGRHPDGMVGAIIQR